MRLLHLLYLGLLSVLLLFTACSSDCSEGTAPEEGLPMTIQMDMRGYRAGTEDGLLTYPDRDINGTLHGTHHVSTVYVLVFEGSGAQARYTGYVQNIGWKEHFGGVLPEHTEEMPYILKYQFNPGVAYTLLGVGFSEGYDIKFQFPAELKEGTTLQEATIGLAEASLTSSLAQAEIFSGTCDYRMRDGSEGNRTRRTVVLKRRVAGVKGYFTNVPHRIALGEETVNELRISLYTKQNTAFPLVKRRQTPYFEDFIQRPSTAGDGQVIVRIPIPENITSKDVVKGGSFMLPACGPQDKEKYTLLLELVHQEKQTEKVLKAIRVKLGKGDELDHGETGGGTGIIDSESAYRYPIIANHFYSIGQPEHPTDIKGNGEEVTIDINPAWKEDNDLNVSE